MNADGSTLKLIQHIQIETLVTGCMWLDQRRTFGQHKGRGTCWITDRVSEYSVPRGQLLGHDLQLLQSGERQSDTVRITPRKPATAVQL